MLHSCKQQIMLQLSMRSIDKYYCLCANQSDVGVFLTDKAINAEFFVVGPNKLLNKQARCRRGLLSMYLSVIGDVLTKTPLHT